MNAPRDPAPQPRLGRVQKTILEALDSAGGFLRREDVVDAVFPQVRAQPNGARKTDASHSSRQRGSAEASISRAIASLERNGMIVREHNPKTGRTSLRAAHGQDLPEWELIARAEEDHAAHCLLLAAQWTALARRSHRRAAAVRQERTVEGTEEERQADLAAIARLHHRSGGRR